MTGTTLAFGIIGTVIIGGVIGLCLYNSSQDSIDYTFDTAERLDYDETLSH